jgi:serine/threonine protein phosphatase PrpC
MQLQSAARTHLGRRQNNEDAFCLQPETGLFAVADGMGGYEGGEVASRLAVEALGSVCGKLTRDAEATWPYAADPALTLGENLLTVAVRHANDRVLEQRTGLLSSMGSTVAALLVDPRSPQPEAVIGHVGDSRVYRLRDGVLEPLTRDHSLYCDLLAQGADLPPKHEYPYANVITRALGMDALQPEVRRERLRPGDTFLLCTDGLLEKLPETVLAALLALPDVASACERLVAEAYARGGKDNITCVVVRVTA